MSRQECYTLKLPDPAESEVGEPEMRAWIARVAGGDAPFWVFAYGSLIWDPDIPYVERRDARIYGYHRAFCIRSFHYRGTRANPGLVLGLDRGGSCHGVAYRVPPEDARAAAAYLWRREMITHVYRPRVLRARTPEGMIAAHAFAARRHHAQYAGRLTLDEMACVICDAGGDRGSNLEYLDNTVAHLRALGLADRSLRRLQRVVHARADAGARR